MQKIGVIEINATGFKASSLLVKIITIQHSECLVLLCIIRTIPPEKGGISYGGLWKFFDTPAYSFYTL